MLKKRKAPITKNRMSNTVSRANESTGAWGKVKGLISVIDFKTFAPVRSENTRNFCTRIANITIHGENV